MGRILESFNHCKGLWKIIFAIYFFQLLLAATVGLQMKQVLDSSIGNSLSVRHLVDGFDYTVFSDFVNVHGGSFSVLYGQMRWMVLIYLIFASFISTGLIYVLAKNSKEYDDFFKGGAIHFGRLLILDILFALATLIIVGISFGTIGVLFNIAPTEFDTELVFLRLALGIGLLATFFIIILTIWKIKIKFHYLDSEEGVLRSVGQGFRTMWKDKWKSIFYSILFLFITILLLFINHLVGNLPMIIMIVIQQLFMLFKILWRIMYYDVLGKMVDPMKVAKWGE